MRQDSTYAIGYFAEYLCMLRLWGSGWRVLAHRFRHPVGEVDLIAGRGKTVIFIEVKVRNTARAAVESIHPQQQQRILRAASAWVAKHPQFAGHATRFDVMILTRWPWPRWMKNAFHG